MKIITRQQAIKQNLKYYFTGIACPNGHICKRSVHNCTCYECKCQSRRTSTKKNYLINRAKANRYRSNKMQRTPRWSDLAAITEFYKNCPQGMVVDHIVPLQGKKVSGLHVLENLQYLTPQQNQIKSNLF